MDSDRIKEIQMTTAYPESVSVKQALLQVWKECEGETMLRWVMASDSLPKKEGEYFARWIDPRQKLTLRIFKDLTLNIDKKHFSNLEWLDESPPRPDYYPVMIVCPECRFIQAAIVEKTIPFGTYIHHCKACAYTIMASEWEEVKPYKVNT